MTITILYPLSTLNIDNPLFVSFFELLAYPFSDVSPTMSLEHGNSNLQVDSDSLSLSLSEMKFLSLSHLFIQTLLSIVQTTNTNPFFSFTKYPNSLI